MDRRTMMIALALIGATTSGGCEGARAARAEPTTQASAAIWSDTIPKEAAPSEAALNEAGSEPVSPAASEVESVDAPLAAESEPDVAIAQNERHCAIMRTGARWCPDETPRPRVRRRGTP